MKRTKEEIEQHHEILRCDPQAYIALMNDLVAKFPNDSDPYFARHYGWLHLNRLDLAYDDLCKSISLKRDQVSLKCRGRLFMRMGMFQDAATDLAEAEAIDPVEWRGVWGPLYQAHCYELMGNEAAALAACERLADDHWSPGLHGAPRGDKAQVTEEIRRRFAAKENGGKAL